MNDPVDSRLALLALAAENMFTDPAVLAPPADPYLTECGYTVRTNLIAVDAVRGIDAQHVFFGFVAEGTPGDYLVAVRGTERFVEWVIDGEFALDAFPGGKDAAVEAGFWGVYRTLTVLEDIDYPADTALASLLKGAKHVTVVGHSLGAAVATYLAYDLAQPQRFPDLTARVFASPRPGNHVFTQLVDSAIADCRAYAYERDLVPRVPFALGYSPLGSLIELPADRAIRDNPLSNHHAANYAWLIDHATAAPIAQLPA